MSTENSNSTEKTERNRCLRHIAQILPSIFFRFFSAANDASRLFTIGDEDRE